MQSIDSSSKLYTQNNKLSIEKGYIPAQLAISWLLAHGDDIITIPGSKDVRHLKENCATEQVILTKEELHRIKANMPAE